jgi:hypothetical protein
METDPSCNKHSLMELFQVYRKITKEKSRDQIDKVIHKIEESTTKKDKTISPGKIRSFWRILGLSILSLGTYMLYWTYQNIVEINDYFNFSKSKNSSSIARKLFGWYFFLTIGLLLVIFIGCIISGKTEFIKHPFYLMINLGIMVFNLYFNYHFIAAIKLAQDKIGIKAFSILNIFIFYLLILLAGLISRIIPILSWFGLFFFQIYIFIVQREINKVWVAADARKMNYSAT